MIENASKLQPLTIMRPRFSLKWLLVAFAIAAICLLVFYVYPTGKAERLASAINRGEVHPYDVVEQPETFYFGNPQRTKILGRKTAVAQLAPRTWSDLWHARRRIEVTMTWSLESQKYELLHYGQLVSSLSGFQLYNWNEREVRMQVPTTVPPASP